MQKDNSSTDWDAFDAAAYSRHNYARLRADDRQIMTRSAEFFASAGIAEGARGLDVGPGSNIYPALVLLPFCRDITFWEHSASNVAWLESEVPAYGTRWDPYWDALARGPVHGTVPDPRGALAERARVVHGSVLDMPRRTWDVGTMFFVAESMTTLLGEFEEAVAGFLGALRPGAPFAAAFVENSEGYFAGAHPFPAVRVGADDVRAALAAHTEELSVERVGLVDVQWRDGYTGMVFATGRSRGELPRDEETVR